MDKVRLEYWNENSGQFPVFPWIMYMDVFQYVHGFFSREIVDIILYFTVKPNVYQNLIKLVFSLI